MTTKTIKIGIKQQEVELRDVEHLDFDTYKNKIRTYEKTEKHIPQKQQKLTAAQRAMKAEIMRANALNTNAKIKADARAYQETHGISEQHWWCETCEKAIKKAAFMRTTVVKGTSKLSRPALRQHRDQR